MKHCSAKILFLTLLLVGYASISNAEHLLDELSDLLSEAKRSNEIYFVQCPENIASLIGVSRSIVVSKLGAAPYIDKNEEIYSFVKEFDESKFGVFTGEDGIDYVVLPPHGGWTNLVLVYDGDHVASAQCQGQRPQA